MPSCECGCGQEATRDFLRGHDQRLRVALEAKVGGLLQLRALFVAAEQYAAGEIAEGSFTQTTRAIFAKAWRQEPRQA